MVLYFQQNIKAQSISEISAYLCDSIEYNADTFAYKSFKEFMAILKYPVKHYSLGQVYFRDTKPAAVSSIILYFETVTEVALKDISGYVSPRIEVFFLKTYIIKNEHFQKNGVLEWSTEWNDEKTKFIGDFKISHLFAFVR